MGIFSSHIGGQKRYALLEVESGSVACMVYEYEKTSVIPKLLLEKRIHIDLKEGFTLIAIVDELPKALRKLTDAMAPFGRLERIDVALGAPWAYVAHIEAKKTAEKPFIISKKIQDEALTGAIGIDKKLNDTIFQLIGPYTKNLIVQSMQIESARINGYPVTVFLGKKATTFDATITQKVTIGEVYKEIEEATDPLSIERTRISDSMSSFTAFPKKEPTLVIDVGSYTTELSYVRGARIERYAILPFGVETAIRALASIKQISRAEADSYVAVLEEHLDAKTEGNMLKELDGFTSVWLQAVREYVQECTKEMQVIDAILLITGAHERMFLSLLKEDSFIKTRERKYYGLEQDKISFTFSNGIARDKRLAALGAIFCTKN